MRIKKLFAGILAGAMALSCMVMPAGADGSASTISITIEAEGAEKWWYSQDISSTGLVGDSGIAPGAVTSITATTDATGKWGLYWYDSTGNWVSDVDEADVHGGSYTLNVSTDLYNGTLETLDWGGCFGVVNGTEDETQTYEFSVTYADEYDATYITYPLSESDLENSYYIITVTNSDGDTAELKGNTYYVDSEGDYYIGLDVSDIPYNQVLTITNAAFY